MTDQELLELAAKAAGIKIDKSQTNGSGIGNNGFDILGNVVLDWHNGTKWNPLEDDGDALRLAVKLKVSVEIENSGTVVFHGGNGKYAKTRCNLLDKEEATRRAIVMAAAHIGQNMK